MNVNEHLEMIYMPSDRHESCTILSLYSLKSLQVDFLVAILLHFSINYFLVLWGHFVPG